MLLLEKKITYVFHPTDLTMIDETILPVMHIIEIEAIIHQATILIMITMVITDRITVVTVGPTTGSMVTVTMAAAIVLTVAGRAGKNSVTFTTINIWRCQAYLECACFPYRMWLCINFIIVFFSILVTSLIQIGNAKVMSFQIEDLRKTLEYTRTLTAGNPCWGDVSAPCWSTFGKSLCLGGRQTMSHRLEISHVF